MRNATVRAKKVSVLERPRTEVPVLKMRTAIVT